MFNSTSVRVKEQIKPTSGRPGIDWLMDVWVVLRVESFTFSAVDGISSLCGNKVPM